MSMGGIRKEVIVDQSPFFGIVHQYLGLGTSFFMEAVCKVLLGPIFSSLLGEIFPCSGYAVNFHALLKHVHHVAPAHSHQNICHLQEETKS